MNNYMLYWIMNRKKMTVARDAYKRHNGVGRPGHCPGTDKGHDGFGNFYLYITSLLIYGLIT